MMTAHLAALESRAVGKPIARAGVPTPAAPLAPAALYLLADHLDAILAAGEDILAIGRLVTTDGVMDPPLDGAARPDIGGLAQIRALEFVIVARTMQARLRALELADHDRRVRMIARLFHAGTTPLMDRIADTCDLSCEAFENGCNAVSFLRDRGLIDAEAGTMPDVGVKISRRFRLLGEIELGVLMELVATFLDTLELHYELFEAAEAGGSGASVEKVERDVGARPDEAEADQAPAQPELLPAHLLPGFTEATRRPPGC